MLYDPTPEFRQCSKCNKWKPATNKFFKRRKNKKGEIGLRRDCKVCRASYRRRNYADNREAKRTKARYYYNIHLDRMREYCRARRKTRSHIYSAIARRWQQNHPDKIKVNFHQRYTRKLNLPNQFTAEDWERCLEYFDYRCAICNRPRGLWHTLAMDHWIPITSPNCPGTIPFNIVPLCHGIDGCNNSKSNNDPVAWINRIFNKQKAKVILDHINSYFEWVKSR